MTKSFLIKWLCVVSLIGANLSPLPSTANEKILATGPTISSGISHVCAITEQGDVRCWGDNTFGQLISPALSNIKFTQISSGAWHSCAVAINQEVICWGRNDYGQIGVPSSLGAVKKVVASGHRSCAVRLNGKIVCWGSKVNGLWNHIIPGGTDVAVGPNHTCVLGAAGSISCTDGMQYPIDIAVPNLVGVTEIYSGAVTGWDPASTIATETFCAKSANQLLTCWGTTEFGSQYEVPSNLGAVYDVSIGNASICAITTVRQLRCWGERAEIPSDLVQVTQVALGYKWGCVIHNSGELRCWGGNGGCFITGFGDLKCWGNSIAPPQDIGTSTKILSLEGMLQKFRLSSEPSIVGDARVGATLTANVGNWSPTTEHVFSWYRVQRDIEIEVGSKASYSVKPQDVGHSLILRVTASRKGFFSLSADSPKKDVKLGKLKYSPTPKIKGIPKTGMTLTAILGSWDRGSTLSVRWYRTGSSRTQGTKSTYKLTSKDKGKKITLIVTGYKDGYEKITRSSIPLNVK